MIAPISFALLGLSHLAASHMVMKTPKPFASSKFAADNGPLSGMGTDYPCKFPYDPEGASNEMPLGSTQQLSFTGHAVHGGGSCQVSIAYDPAPTANTSFKVIHSIMGGCPSRSSPDNSQGPDVYDFKIPENLPAGNAVLAWTWFNKIGNREMYMDCAPVRLTGGPEKRDPEERKLLEQRAEVSYNALPDIMVANINNGCATIEGKDYEFDSPGDNVEVNAKNGLSSFVGCCGGKCYGGYTHPVNPKDGRIQTSDATYEGSSLDAPQGAASDAQSPKKQQEQPENSSAEPGAFFTTGDQPTTSSNDQKAQRKPAPSSAPSDATMAPSTGPETNSTVSSDTKAGSACSPEGLWNCVGGHSYQQCASGAWSVVMPMADGTQCQAGKTKTFQIHTVSQRSLRHPRSHMRRHQLGLNHS